MRVFIVTAFTPDGGAQCPFIGEDGDKAEQAYESAIESGKFAVVELYTKPDPSKRRKVSAYNEGLQGGPVIRDASEKKQIAAKETKPKAK